jgi:hypothetical protein
MSFQMSTYFSGIKINMVKQVTSIMYFAKEVAVKKGRRQDLVEVSIRDAVAISQHDFLACRKKIVAT